MNRCIWIVKFTRDSARYLISLLAGAECVTTPVLGRCRVSSVVCCLTVHDTILLLGFVVRPTQRRSITLLHTVRVCVMIFEIFATEDQVTCSAHLLDNVCNSVCR